ncbi:MAG: hypothetical protein PHU33_10080 [Bacteroidales bacterium]|nr:hypothetical protein [Bacteroidales bacterium]
MRKPLLLIALLLAVLAMHAEGTKEIMPTAEALKWIHHLSDFNGQTITTPGTYPFTLVNYMGCDSLVTYTVNAAANPVVNLPANQTLCPGDEITLDAGPGYASYLWSTTATTQTIVATQPGTYTVTVTNAAGCQASDSFVYSSSGPPPNPIKHN